MNIPTHFRLFTVKYMGPTNTRGSRVKITDERHKESVTIPYDYSMNNTTDMANKYLAGRGIKVTGFGGLDDGRKAYVLMSENFAISLK